MGFWDWIFGRKETEAPRISLALQSAPPRLPAAPPPPEVPAAPPKPTPPRYGIDAAIALMRALPMDEDPELVLRVVRKTLRSTGVSVEELIDNARTREGALSESIAEDRRTIDQLERDIADRRAHIETVAKQLAETESVRERLQEAVQTESKVGMLLPPEEIARLHAERVATGATPRASSRIPPPPGATAGVVSPPSIAPSALKNSKPPVPKTSFPPSVARPATPQPPRAVPSQAPSAPKVAESARDDAAEDDEDEEAPTGATPGAPDIDSLFETEDPKPSEPTVRKAINVLAGGANEEAEKTS